MNKNFHRIVFNAARGLRMVVQEKARSAGKGGSGACGGATSAVVSVVALAAAVLSAPLHAQIVADPGAPGRQRATVLAAPNGVPLVNIQSPSAAGVSRNTYSQFDVQAQGAILNNSRTNAQTQLGGWVQGNPWLAAGPARVILNEVNSASPSQLRGYVEVAGQRAEVVIANPAGIQVNGGGFINTSRATLTTGAPQLDARGGLDGFLVRGGTIAIDGAGLDAGRTDYAAILARALQVNAGLWANELKVVTGANQVSADAAQAVPAAGSGAAPVFALDVAALGGMYAGKITLIGTEAGVGARNAGHIGAGTGGLVVTAAGRLENTGTLEGQKVELTSAGDAKGLPVTRELTDEEKRNLQPSPDNKVHIANNGIFNDVDAAAKYAAQHSTADGGPQYLIYFPEANATVSELMVAGYQHFLEGDTLGKTNATQENLSMMETYGQSGLHLDGHSRGSMTVGNAMESLQNQPYSEGSLSGTTVNFFGPAYNVQDADNTLSNLQNRSGADPQQQSGMGLQYQNHVADPVGALSGMNPGTGGTIPEGSSVGWEAIRAATGQPNTVHNCYGSSNEDACKAMWRDTGGYPVLVPSEAPGVKK